MACKPISFLQLVILGLSLATSRPAWASAERSQTLFQLCVACHGLDGQGNQQLGAPPLIISNDWYLLRQLQNLQQKIRGADAPRDPTGAMMQPIANALSEQAMQDVVTYIQTLR